LGIGYCLLLAVGPAAPVDSLGGLDFGGLAPRDIKVYLPPGALTPTTPVLVALDGQNMAAWRLEEAVANLAAKGGRTPPVVVAIPAARDRLDEYGLADQLDYAGRGKKAAEFQRFVIGQVLPAIRARYALKAAPARTGIMGSSLGGMAAFDLAWRHPEAFGFAGIFSGSFWWRGDDSSPAARQQSRLVHRRVRTTATAPRLRLWFEAGAKDETDDRDGNGVIDAVQDTTELLAELEQHGYRRGVDLAYVELADGRHNEATWARALPGFLEWALPPQP
jgi:enterochelin esterase-like enzyme